jgi:hypothetical protein
MTPSFDRLARLSVTSLQGAVVLVDRGFRLHDVAVRNAARAVAADRVSARLREIAANSIAEAATRPELSVVSA